MNEHKIRQVNHANQRSKFMQALSAGQALAIDRFGAVVSVGQKVLVKIPVDPVCEVASVAPVLDPNAPAGLILVTLTTTVQVTCMANQPGQSLIVLPHLHAGAPDDSEPSDPENPA